MISTYLMAFKVLMNKVLSCKKRFTALITYILPLESFNIEALFSSVAKFFSLESGSFTKLMNIVGSIVSKDY